MENRLILDQHALDANKNIIARDYWKTRLSDFEFNAYDNFNSGAMAGRGYQPEVYTIAATPGLQTVINEIAGSDKAKHIVLIAAGAVLISKYTSATDICIYTPLYADLSSSGTGEQVIPIRMSDFGHLRFPAFLAAVKDSLLQDFRHGNYPVDKILHSANEEFSSPCSIGLCLDGLQPVTAFDNFPVDLLFILNTGDKLTATIKYNTSRFDEEYVSQLAQHYFGLLQRLLLNKEKAIKEIEITDEKERTRLLYEFNDTAVDFPVDQTIIDLFEERVKMHPDHIALRCSKQTVSYRQLNERSNKMAAYLVRQYGVKKGDLIGVLLTREEHLLVTIFGILKAGCAYVPIDPGFPAGRINTIIEDSGMRVLISRSEHLVAEMNMPAGVVNLDTAIEALREELPKALPQKVTSKDLAYVIYTSGSTGKPKGVMIEHGTVVNRLYWMQQQYPIDERDVLLQKTPIVFDVSVWELFWWSFTGASLCLLKPGGEKDPGEIIKAIKENKVTTIHFVPSMLGTFLAWLDSNRGDLSSLRLVFASGEALKTGQVQLFGKTIHNSYGARLINLYGPTEATVDVSFYECDFSKECKRVPIGKPISNIRLYVLDKNRQLVPLGVAGELYISGGLARGYLNNEALTAAKFTEHPYIPNERIYSTGDLVRQLPDGNIDYISRIDDQVKIRGFRIELGEIEQQLNAIKQVRESVVVAKEKDDEKYLVAYYLADKEIAWGELKNDLWQTLPEYMHPSYYVWLDAFPLTSNGKINRKALPDPNISKGLDYVAPSNAIEEKLVDIWSEVLNLNKEKISVNNSFFELGGHSLKASIAVNRILKELQADVTLGFFFNHPDIRSIANLIQEKQATPYSAITKAAAREYYDISSAQKRLYFLYHFDKTTTAYNVPTVLNIKGEMDTDKLAQAFKQLIERHEILRTAFMLKDGKPVQQILPEVHFELEIYHSSKPAITSTIRNFRRPFDLSKAPLIRAGLIRTAEADQVLIIDLHHIITDLVSQTILFDELMAIYAEKKLPSISCQYKDYVEWQIENEKQDKLSRQQEYWLSVFSTMPSILELPGDFKRPSQKDFGGDSMLFSLNETETTALRKLAKEHNVSMYMLLLAIYNVFLSKIGNEEDIVIGTLMAGRQHPEFEKMVGMFANTLALRNSVPGRQKFTAFLENVKRNVIQALDNQAYPYDDLVDQLQLERNTSRNPLFDVVFVFQNYDPTTALLPELEIASFTTDYKLSKFDLTLAVVEGQHTINLEFEYSTGLFKEQTISRFVSFFKQIIAQLISGDHKYISQISIVKESEKASLLKKFDFADVAYPAEKNMVEIFEQQVKRYPNNIAVEFEGATVSYKELNERANQLAHYLIKQGVKPDTVVGLFLDRSINMIVSILAVIKAGGAYLPIEIDSPAERTRLLLDDCQAQWLITAEDMDGRLDKAINKIFIDRFTGNAADKENPATILSGNNLCYIIYTSGTTGRPKGVMVDHKNLMSLFFNEAFRFEFTADDVWTMFHRYCFDFSVWEMYGALLFGGKLVIVSKQNSIDPQAFLNILKDRNVTVLNQTPTAFNNLIRQEKQDIDPQLKLRYVIFGGEALNPKNLDKWVVRYPDTKLINMFGITETTVHVTYKEITQHDIFSNTSNIGIPLPAMSGYILDKDLNIVPAGFAGELYVGGGGVSRGYINNVELTHQKFIENPYQRGMRLYKSGDLVRVIDNGEIEYKGRIDTQVQLKGFRIELGEIESTLIKYRFIKEARVLFREREGVAFLVAYYVADSEIAPTQLRKVLAASLPLYMIPAWFIKVDYFPATVNGKLDIDKLPDPNVTYDKDYEHASTKNEIRLAEIWMKILGLPNVGVNDNYFVLGGDSIIAIRLIIEINKSVAATIKIVDLYNCQTIRELAAFIDNAEVNQDDAGNTGVEEELRLFHENYIKNKPNDRIEAVYPMSNIEKGMCYVHLKNPEDILYYEQLVWPVFYENFNLDIVKKAVHLLTRKHSALRTAFDLSEFAHIVYKDIIPELPYTDISHVSRIEQEALIKTYMQESRAKHFELNKAPLWKMSAFRLGENYHVVLFEIHHAISDGWSIATFLNELNNTYSELLVNSDYTPPLLKSGFKDFIADEIAYAKDEKNIDYWKNELAGSKKYSFGVNSTDKVYNSCKIPFDGVLYQQLENLAVSKGCNVKNVFFAAYIYTLKLLTYENDIVVGMVTFNRSFGEDSDRVFGNFLNTIPVRMKIEGTMTGGQLLDMVNEKLLEVKKHDRSSLFNINKALGSKGYGDNPITDLLFNFTNFHSTYEINLEKVVTENKEPLDVQAFVRGHSLFDVNINGDKGHLFIHYDYVSSFLNAELFDQFNRYFNRILQLFAISHEEELKIESIIGQQEMSKMLHDFNNTVSPFPSDKTIVGLFEEQAAANRDAIAVIAGSDEYTYGELDRRSNCLAASIIEKGIFPGCIVAIAVERSFEMMIGIMGILKAGCAYMPIDPNNPVERNKYMLQDTSAGLLLTQKKFVRDFEGLLDVLDLEDKSLYQVARATNHVRRVMPEDMAYVIYTSGSTGKPKGVAINHNAVVNRLHWMQKAYPINRNDVLLQKTPYTFDVSVWELFWGLFQGAKLVILKPGGEKEPQEILRVIETCQVSVIHFVPSMLYIFLEVLKIDQYDSKRIQSLRYVFCSGEALTPALVRTFNGTLLFDSIQLINLYGPTEATVDVTYFNCGHDADIMRVPIGRPINNTKLYILDKNNNLLPPGIAGELCIGGIGVARGYINKAALTNEKFIQDAYDGVERIYKAGDLARWLDDGNIEYLGRIDDQVKIRGNRIELGEIESVLLTIPGITNAVVLTKEENGELKIIAFYKAEERQTSLKIKAFLRKRLPEYMIPFKLMQVAEIPVTSNGKANRKELLELYTGEPKQIAVTAPSSPLEKEMARIWTEEIGVQSISMDDSFFDIGGHSLSAIKIVERIKVTFGVEPRLTDFFNQSFKQFVNIYKNKLAEHNKAIPPNTESDSLH